MKLKINLPYEIIGTLGINEDTTFESYYKDGAIYVRILGEESENNDAIDDEDVIIKFENVSFFISWNK